MEAALKVLSRSFPGCPAFACKSKQLILVAGRWTAADLLSALTLGLMWSQFEVGAGWGASREQWLLTRAPGVVLFPLYLCNIHHGNHSTSKHLMQLNEEFHIDSRWRKKTLQGPEGIGVIFKGTELRGSWSCSSSWVLGISSCRLLGLAIRTLTSQGKKRGH